MVSVAAYRAGSLAARHVPVMVQNAAARAVGSASAVRTGQKQRVVARNLERVLGRTMPAAERRRRVAKTFEWYTRYYAESFRLPSVPIAEIDRGFGHEGFGEIAAAVQRGQGPILALPHLGTWEWAAWWLALVPEFKVTAVAEPLEPPEVFEWFVGFREQLGMDIVPLGPDAASTSIEALKQGQVLCLLADRDIQGNGVVVEFFGERTTLPAGPATLALRTGSPLIPSAVYWRGDTRHAICMPPLDTSRRGKLRQDVARVTQDMARDFEYLIKQAPEQWHMLSPNWPSDYRALGLPLPEHLRDL